MEPENVNQEAPQVEQVSSLHQVTPLSKYLAMALFVVLPFAGGYIGYTLAPESVVEVAEEVPASVQKNGSNNFKSSYQNQFGSDTEIEFLYKSNQTGLAYFKTLNYSSVPSRLVVLNSSDGSFIETDFFIDFAAGEASSQSGRFISNIDDYSRPTTSISIIDLETGTVVKIVNLSDSETLWAGKCGYAGPTFDMEWVGSSTIKYGVYELSSVESEGCDTVLIEYREESF